jgi:hypothetical protein
MNRPQIINPETKHIINLFSDDVQSLLDDGYTIDDILTLPILPVSKHIPVTGITDLDYNIFLNLEIEDLINICAVNNYTKSICDNKTFWLRKMEINNLSLPNLPIKNINWFKLYEAIRMTQDDIMVLNMPDELVVYYLDKIYPKTFVEQYLSLVYDESISFDSKIKEITCTKNNDYKCRIVSKSQDNIIYLSEDKFNLLIILLRYDDMIYRTEFITPW